MDPQTMNADQVKQAGLDYGIFERVQDAWTWWQSHVRPPARVRIVGDDDSDGVTSTYIVANTLRRAGYDVDVILMPVHAPDDVHVAMREPRLGYVVLDSGSGVLETIDSHRIPTLVIDHHRVHDVIVQNTFEVNPRRVGGDRVEHVSTSVLAGLFAVAAGNHWDLAFAAVAGGISDRQHLGGFRGLLGNLVAGALRHGSLTSSVGLNLVGETVESAIADSLDPYFEAYAGKPDSTKPLLSKHGIAPGTSPLTLAAGPAQALADDLTQTLRAKGVVTDRMPPLFGERYALAGRPGLPTVFALSQILETVMAAKRHEVALRVLAGDAEAVAEAKRLLGTRVRAIQKEVARLRGHTQELPHVRWAETQDPSNTGVYAHTLLTFLYGDDKPFLVTSRQGDVAKCSARGSARLYRAGVDLSIGLHEAAEAVGGHGGGHPGASGATIPYARRDDFIQALNRVLGRLGRRPPA